MRIHLSPDHALERAVDTGGTDDRDPVALLVSGHEERNALDVIPMRVADEQVRVQRPALHPLAELDATRARARARIADEKLIGDPYFDARRVTAVLCGGGSRCGDGPARAPELHLDGGHEGRL